MSNAASDAVPISEWTASDIPDLTDRTIVVTGANSGLGLVAARQLARHGASVILACRNIDKGLAALDLLRSVDPDVPAEVRELDLATLDSVRRFADDLARDLDSLDVLVNNAGVMAIPRRETADGFEMQFGTNHLGHFALTGRLLPMLRRGDDPRVVTVSSGAHRVGKINFDDIHGESRYRRWGAYGQSKLANLLFTYELARRIDAADADLTAMAAHPGYAATNLQGVGPSMSGRRVSERLMSVTNAVLAQSADQGALPTLYAATADGVANGDYYGPDGIGEQRGKHPRKVDSSRRSHDVATARKLWDLSEELTGVSFDLA